MAKHKKSIAIVTPLATPSLPTDFHITSREATQYLIANVNKLPFDVVGVRVIEPPTFPIDANRNECVAWIKHHKVDISVWIDGDQKLNQTTIFDLLNKGYEYPIYAGMYYLKEYPYYPVVFKSDDKFAGHKPILKFPTDKLFYADMIGMGCVKIDTEVFEKLNRPYFKYQRMRKNVADRTMHPEYSKFKYFAGVNDVSEDVWFWKQVRDKTDYRIVVDPQIQVGHITQLSINYNVFRSFYDANEQLVKKSMEKEEFKKFMDGVCQAEIVKLND